MVCAVLTRQVVVSIQMPSAEILYASACRVLRISMEHAKRVIYVKLCLVEKRVSKLLLTRMNLASRAGCGIQLYRFLKLDHHTRCLVKIHVSNLLRNRMKRILLKMDHQIAYAQHFGISKFSLFVKIRFKAKFLYLEKIMFCDISTGRLHAVIHVDMLF